MLLYWKMLASSRVRAPLSIGILDRNPGTRFPIFRVASAPSAERAAAAAGVHHPGRGLCGLAAVAFHISVVHLYGAADRSRHFGDMAIPGSGGRFSRRRWAGWWPAWASPTGFLQRQAAAFPKSRRRIPFATAPSPSKRRLASSCSARFNWAWALHWELKARRCTSAQASAVFWPGWHRLSPMNCRRMTSVGMAAGIAAAFNAPIAAVTFTLEELIGTLDQTMLTGVIVAAALAAVVEQASSAPTRSFMCRIWTTRWLNPRRWSGMRCWVFWRRSSRWRLPIRCCGCAPGSRSSPQFPNGFIRPWAARQRAALPWWRSSFFI